MSYEEVLNLFKNCIFEDLCEDAYDEQILANLPENLDYIYESGATKVVFIIENLDYVVKIPFHGRIEYGYGEDEEDIFEEFSGAVAVEGSNCWDYCKEEVFYYQKAKEKNIEKFFLETSILGYSNDNYPIYMQPKARIFNYSKSKSLSEEEQIITNRLKSKCDTWFSARWIRDAINWYGENEVEKLLNFINDEKINDLHSGNLGYLNDRPVIVDYAGYNH